jgi:hypothetical protein
VAKRKPTNPDVVLVRTPLERAFCSARIPAYLWNPDPRMVTFMSTAFKGKSLSAYAQKQWVVRLVKETPRKAPTVVIGSKPTDTGALHAAYCLLSSYIRNRGRDVAVIDAAQPLSYLETYPGCLVVHNILDKATIERVQQVRDILSRFLHAFRIVVIGGNADPEKWITERAAIYPDVVLRVADVTPEQLRRDG